MIQLNTQKITSTLKKKNLNTKAQYMYQFRGVQSMTD